MKLLICDSDQVYLESKSTHAFLFRGYILEKWSLNNSPDEFNMSLNGIEYAAADAMHVELSKMLDYLDQYSLAHNKFVATRKNKRDIHFSLLYNSYWQLVIKKHVLRLVIEKLLTIFSNNVKEIEISLSEDYRLAEIDFRQYFKGIKLRMHFRADAGIRFKRIKPIVKNLGYFVYRFYKKVTGYGINKHPGKKNILLFIYDVPSLHIVLQRFYELVKLSNKVHLHLVTITSGIPEKKAIDPKNLQGKNISVYDYKIFRNGNFQNHRDLYQLLEVVNSSYSLVKEKQFIENLEIQYSWIGNMVAQIKPDITLTLSLSESGRALSDVSRFFDIPSVNVDYGLFTDDPLFMQSNIEFTYRACISQANVDIWHHRKDPTLNYRIIGFCKLDAYKNFEINREAFFKRFGLNNTANTIFFASSWTAQNKSYELEKQKIVQELAELCNRNNWNLIVKKHPAEYDNICKLVLKEHNFPNQILFDHEEINLHELLSVSTVVTTQSSSLVIDAMYFDKPFCFFSYSLNQSVTDFYTSIKKDELIQTVNTIDEFELFAKQFSSDKNKNDWFEKLALSKAKYLYKTDGNASQRLLDLLIEC
ncbi:MAG TPA: CDP-glycerol glycerophosphotransferase family protein [Bacteroidia bacterium]|nr:CDP-glycerol glycerophosphotransferase family protein [Bacteroidia bacterium]HRH09428.1 CDP-glycerol glycerophosphotransferase family protein [Bacteroidia bacterium]HRH62648.1 CDP-glycerol glycerophosphotransferase family protein [Bacteroidia bacterium]